MDSSIVTLHRKGGRKSTRADFWARVDIRGPDDCWLWTGKIARNGYGHLGYHGKDWSTHRLAAHFRGIPIDGLIVCHHCDIRSCCNPAHLFTGSQKDNIQDALSKGRMATGERNGSHTMPERRPTGLRNGAYTNPGRRPRGDSHGIRKNPALVTGENNPRAKVTESEVSEMRARYAAGDATYSSLQNEYGIGKTTVGHIIAKRSWKHVP